MIRHILASTFLLLVCSSIAKGQPALSEPPDFPNTRPGFDATYSGMACFHLASGQIVPGDVDRLRITIPIASAPTIIDLDFSDAAASRLQAQIGSTAAIGLRDDNDARDNVCGLGSGSNPVGSLTDSVVQISSTPRNAVIDIDISGAGDFAFNGSHTQTFTYDVWVHVTPVPCELNDDCDDGVGCTDDTCDQMTGLCANVPNDGRCDDGEFCNGEESCDAVEGCQSGEPPDCSDAVDCTVDSCDPQLDDCVNDPSDEFCDDEVFCNGQETCDPLADCQAGDPPSCDDGVGCTMDACDPKRDECTNVPDHARCADTQFCNGAEVCNPDQDCIAGVDPCPGRLCREADNKCVDCLSDDDCDDGAICNGLETCNQAGACEPGSPPCPVGQSCDPDTGECSDALFLTLDIRPGACPNRISLNSLGYFSAALIAEAGLDLQDVEISSIRMTRSDGVGEAIRPNVGAPGPRTIVADVAAPRTGNVCECRESSGDGTADLVLYFSVADAMHHLELGSFTHGDSARLTVTGQWLDGISFVAEDCIMLVGQGRKDEGQSDPPGAAHGQSKQPNEASADDFAPPDPLVEKEEVRRQSYGSGLCGAVGFLPTLWLCAVLLFSRFARTKYDGRR